MHILQYTPLSVIFTDCATLRYDVSVSNTT